MAIEIRLRSKYRYVAPGTHKSTHNSTGSPHSALWAGMYKTRRAKHSFHTASTQWGFAMSDDHKPPAAIPQEAKVLVTA